MEAPTTAPVSTGEPIDPMIEALDAPPTDVPDTYVLFGETFTARSSRPAGAFAVFCARLKSNQGVTQAAAPYLLLERYTIEEDHDRLAEAMSNVEDLETFLSGDFARIIEGLLNRPT